MSTMPTEPAAPPTLVSTADYEDATENYRGFCVRCKEFTRDNTEPDAHGYDCPACEQRSVVGAEDALMEGLIELEEEEK